MQTAPLSLMAFAEFGFEMGTAQVSVFSPAANREQVRICWRNASAARDRHAAPKFGFIRQ
jgi:hypothetical protein